jgi:stress-induced-phosphoprotein 1
MSKAKQQAQEYKEKGNKAFTAEKYADSITWYTKAIQSDPNDHVLYSNRSAAYPYKSLYNMFV